MTAHPSAHPPLRFTLGCWLDALGGTVCAVGLAAASAATSTFALLASILLGGSGLVLAASQLLALGLALGGGVLLGAEGALAWAAGRRGVALWLARGSGALSLLGAALLVALAAVAELLFVVGILALAMAFADGLGAVGRGC